MAGPIVTVFSRPPYAALGCAVAAGMALPLLILSEYVFFEPYVVAHLPPRTELGLALIVAISVLSGLVIPMNVYRIRALRASARKLGGGMLGSVVGAAAGACSCGPVGFAIISTFGTAGAVASAFLTNYEIPLRLGAVGLLCLTLWTTSRSLRSECAL